MTDLTVTVVLYNSKATLPAFASSLTEVIADGTAKVVAVDNASADGSAALLAELMPAAEIIENPDNRGYAVANNQTWPLVEGRYWLLLNPDVATDGPSIRTLVSWMDERPDVAVASPLLRGTDGAPEMVARALPDLRWRTLEMLRLHHFATRDARSRHLLGHYWLGADRIHGWVPGAAMMLRRSAVEQVGVLSEASFMYGEDLELCWRMQRQGWAVGVCRDCEFIHVKGASSGAAWTNLEVERRIASAELTVARGVKGRVWARAYALVVGLSQLVETLHPRRSRDQRRVHRLIARTWLGRTRR